MKPQIFVWLDFAFDHFFYFIAGLLLFRFLFRLDVFINRMSKLSRMAIPLLLLFSLFYSHNLFALSCDKGEPTDKVFAFDGWLRGVRTNFKVERNDGPSMSGDGTVAFNKFNAILGGRFSYRITFPPIATPDVLRLTLRTDKLAMSPLIEVVGLKPSCNFASVIRMGSLAQLQNATTLARPGAYFRDPSRYVSGISAQFR